jgi:hypothetical protein
MIPTPPAEVRQAPAPRELAFEGFNHFPLSGTVLPAEGSAVFAVLVADSGPLDRNWSELRNPTHGGLAFAQWLRDQGVASLRFDKRMATSRDPALNCSLDAQAGDIRAAIQAARALPEAQGKAILVVGHGEGALLSLLVAPDADALLLLAMPAQSMGKAIAAQIAQQLPADKAAPNLAYLQSVFAAIRAGKNTPVPGPLVHPSMGRLATSLMAKETLGFVRDTLDLDPWAMASRVAVPVAAAWGDKDLLAARPAPVPTSFIGQTFVIPGANHVFRLEPRSRAELDPAKALEGYKDDRPLADLSPLAAWIKALR